jgi:hypothetical protein
MNGAGTQSQQGQSQQGGNFAQNEGARQWR